MPSPFPGMDPWLEDEEVFPNLHERLAVYLQDALNAVLPPGYVATTKNRVWVDDEVRREPDAAVFGRDRTVPPGGGLAVAPAAPLADPVEEPFLEIRSHGGRRLVTAVEVLSRSNKRPGDGGRTAYLQKQYEYRAAGVNVVEIDLHRGGVPTTAFPPDRRPPAGTFDYHVSVLVPGAEPYCFLAPVRLGEKLPVVPVPLDPDVTPVDVDLQAVFDRCYDGGRYPELVRYDRDPDPPLTPEQKAWADALLKEKGLLP